MQADAIQFRNVFSEKDGQQIIKDITGNFKKGKITMIVGPSGAGKTSLLRLCNGLDAITTGEIQILGKDIKEYNPQDLRRRVGIALQDATMIPGTVKDNLALPYTLQSKEFMEDIGVEVMEKVNLEQHFLKRNSKDLSGGQRQKVSIARTLINEPEILLLDEITSSLDKVSSLEIEKLMLSLNKEQDTTMIWVTHDLEQASRVGDEVWVMVDGELVEFGEINLLQAPKNPLVKQFVKGVIS